MAQPTSEASEPSQVASLESFEALHADLIALSESRLLNVERLEHQLVAHMNDFRALLDRKPRSDQSRHTLGTGKVEFGDQEFSINAVFQEQALLVADDLNLDELDAARICFESESESQTTGRSLRLCALLRFHQRRKYLLDCLCVVLRLADDIDEGDDIVTEGLRNVVQEIAQDQSSMNAAPKYVLRCLASMTDIKAWLQKLVDKMNSATVLGGQNDELEEATEYQRVSLVQQHESLGIVIVYLVKMGFSGASDLDSLLETLRTADKYDHLLLHYFPAVSSYFEYSLSNTTPIAEARVLSEKILRQSEQRPWALIYVHAAIRAWWLAEYSEYFLLNHEATLTQSDLNKANNERSQQFTEALKHGAFDFMLSLSADIKSVDWPDPARNGLRQWLQRKSPALPQDSIRFSNLFQRTLESQLQSFIEAFIGNMPDVLRKLRVDEDEQRQRNNNEHDLDLERFITMISYAFEGQPSAARERFWDSPDGAPLGFLHWASRRASTPLVSAFCEMLRSLSKDEECATSAHEFLLDDGGQSSSRMRRTHSLTWNQIFKELTFFCTKIRNTPAAPQFYGQANNDQAEMEPESFLMLECYLRLITRLCTESSTVRQFLAQHPTFQLTDLLFQLASSSIAPRLKACTFACLRSLLSHKTKVAGDYLWTALDLWISGAYCPGATTSKTVLPASTSSSIRILTDLRTGFEEPNAFIRLLTTLVSPYEEEAGLRDGLPFPENLGATSRMPGIDPYIDFALGQIFGSQTAELNDVAQSRVLKLSCLQFITTCLQSFNEDLVVFANGSNVVVDAAIQTSNLETYVLLHPFSRVMEWTYSEGVMDSLFASIQHQEAEVLSSSPDSPLILCLLKGMEAFSLILDLQPTYLDIVRPLLKKSSRRVPVAKAAFTTFEDGVLNHLSLIADLGLYCGSGQPDLVIASLSLLEKLSASSKFVSSSGTGIGRRATGNKAIAALRDNGQRISMTLLNILESNIDVNQGPDSPEHIMKICILDFLIACLQASPNQPSIGHLLLGFQCSKVALHINPEGPFSDGTSLFHSILRIVLEGDLADETLNVSSWLVSFKLKGLQILKLLWQSPLSSAAIMVELRTQNALAFLFGRQQPLLVGTLEGLHLSDPEFLPSDGASCLSEFLSQRAITLQYVSGELRQAVNLRLPSLKQKILGTLLGTTNSDDGLVQHVSIFDLFDFMGLNFSSPSHPHHIPLFEDIDFAVCLEGSDNELSIFRLDKVQELLLLRRSEVVKSRGPLDATDEAEIQGFIADVMREHAIDNQINSIAASKLRVLQAWTQLVLLMVGASELDGPANASFILRALQTIIPSLESNIEHTAEATELTKLAKCLIFALDFDSDALKRSDLSDLVSDRLFSLFQLSLRAITSITPNPTLKEYYYSICYRFLTGMSDVATIGGIHRRPTMKTIKAAGGRFIDVICDDAYAGEPMCRISALLLLSTLVKMSQKEKDLYAIEALSRLNFIAILVDSISTMPSDLSQAPSENVPLHISYCHARLVLLLHIAQTRAGAAAVLNGGLFASIQTSGLFKKDPDLGVDIHTPSPLAEFYSLLTSLMRLMCAVVLSRGSQNHHTLDQARWFLKENRLSILAILKKSAGVGGGDPDGCEHVVAELAESYVLLMTLTGYLDTDEGVKETQNGRIAFT